MSTPAPLFRGKKVGTKTGNATDGFMTTGLMRAAAVAGGNTRALSMLCGRGTLGRIGMAATRNAHRATQEAHVAHVSM